MKYILFDKKILPLLLVLLTEMNSTYSQTRKLYDINANPFEQFEVAKADAKAENKHIMIQIGGNWCTWCFKFHDFYQNDNELDSIIKSNYIVMNVAFDPVKNQDFFASMAYPQRFGFPVIVITDAEGNHLHTQDSWYLEDGVSSYNKDKFKAFLKNWTRQALNPNSYKK
jgi:thioredoxin-related protein